MSRSFIFSRTTTIGTVDVDPNTLLPTGPVGVAAAGGAVEGAPFETPDTWKEASSAALMLAMARTAGGTSQATVSIWFYEAGFSANVGDNGCWVLLKSGQVVVEGTPVIVPFIRGSNFKLYIEVTATLNSPKGLFGYWIPQP